VGHLYLFLKFLQKMHYNNGVIRNGVIAHENVGSSARNSFDANLTIFMIQDVLFRKYEIEEL